MTMTTMKCWRLMSLWGCWLIVVAYHVDGFCVCQGGSPIKGGWLIWREPEAFAARQHQHPFLSSSSSSTVLTVFLHQDSGTSVVLLLLPPWFHIFDRCSPLFISAGWICWWSVPLFIFIGTFVSCLIFVIFFTRAKFLEDKIYTEKRQFFALNL